MSEQEDKRLEVEIAVTKQLGNDFLKIRIAPVFFSSDFDDKGKFLPGSIRTMKRATSRALDLVQEQMNARIDELLGENEEDEE